MTKNIKIYKRLVMYIEVVEMIELICKDELSIASMLSKNHSNSFCLLLNYSSEKLIFHAL